jgi:hypothetical protein
MPEQACDAFQACPTLLPPPHQARVGGSLDLDIGPRACRPFKMSPIVEVLADDHYLELRVRLPGCPHGGGRVRGHRAGWQFRRVAKQPIERNPVWQIERGLHLHLVSRAESFVPALL